MKKNFLLLSFVILFLLFISASNEEMQDIKPLDLNVHKGYNQTKATLKPDLNFGKFPLYFIANNGQVNEKAIFYAKASRYTLWLTQDGLIFDSVRGQDSESKIQEKDREIRKHKSPKPPKNYERDVSRLLFLNANKDLEIVSIEEAKLKVNYFIGDDSAKWYCDVPTSQAVLYKNLYRNIDLKVYGIEKEIEYDWVVKPGGNPEAIRFEYQNVKGTRIDEKGNLRIETKFGELIHKKPVSYQYIGDKKIMVEAGFNENGENSYGFSVEGYDKNYELIIDPVVLAYSTYLGGGSYEHGYGITVDNSGIVYVTGHTNSTDFPCLDQYSTDQGGTDVFVSKIDPNQSGTACLIYSTYLGGNGDDDGKGIAVDSTGNIYVVGNTYSVDFPTLNHYQVNQGDRDAFLVKMDTASSGTAGLVYSTYLGGDSDDHGNGLAVGNNGQAYVVGSTYSDNFPILNQYQTNQLNSDAYVAVIDTTQSGTAGLIYSTYLGGSSSDYGHGIALDTSGYVYVTGPTISNDFPILNQYQTDPSYGGDFDVYVTKIDPTQSGSACLIYSTYIGGGDHDQSYSIAVDNSGNAYVTGYTESSSEIWSTPFPTRNAYQEKSGWFGFNSSDAFLVRIDTNQSGDSSLIYSTYLGGDHWLNDEDRGKGIAVDNNGCAYVTGYTGCSDFPILDQFQTDQGGDDAFVSKIDTNQSGAASLIFSSYLGGGGHDYGYAIALDSSGNVYVTGRTASYDFPTMNPYQTNSDDYWDDVFITKLAPPNIEIVFPNGNESLEAGSVVDIVWSSVGVEGNVKIEYSVDSGANWSEIVASTENDGSFPWTIPGTISAQCLVRVSEIDGSPSGESEDTFAIVQAPTISGYVTAGGIGMAEVVMNGLPDNPSTDSSGFYSVLVNYGWSGTVTPTYTGYTFTEPSTTYTNVITDQATDYTAALSTYIISGTITHGGVGLENVVMNGLPGNPTPKTDASGFYSAAVNYGWSGTATPTLNDYSFTPSFSTYTNVTSNLTANYTAYLTDQIPPIERQALIDLYVSSNGDNWINNSGWKTPPLQDGFAMPGTEDTWYGITVESNNHVSSIKLGSNGLIGTIPSSIGDLAYLTEIQLYTNQLTGSMPIEIGSLTGLEIIDMSSNQLSGTIPTEIGSLVNLRFLYLYANQLTGSIPPSLGNCLDLIRLYLDENQLTGRVPDELCNLTSLERFDFSSNKIIGNIPSCITNLTSLSDSFTDSGYNALYTNDEDVRIFLTSKDPDWEETQTTAPTNVSAEAVSGNSVQVSWTPILYSADPGGYQVYCGTISGGPYSLCDTTADKTVSSMTVNGLIPDTVYHFVVRARTESHNNNQNVVVSDYSEEVTATTFPGGPSIVVTSPNGDEIWEAGSSQNITWISSGITGDVKIEYSTDGGTSWTVIVPSSDNDGMFGWVVPDVPSENCLVRISESDVDEGLWDVSDRTFSITSQSSPNVRVTSPNGGERLAVGSACDITWASSGAVGDIKIDYSVDNGVSWTNIVASTENDGSYNWVIPNIPSDSCVVRVGEIDGEPCDMSDGVFSIVPASSLTVTSPNGGESWEVGSFYKIRWTGDGNIEEVRIELSTDNGTSWSHIVESTPNDGVYNWGVPGMPSDHCLVRVGKVDSDIGPSDVSDEVFSIVPQTAPTLWITSPNGGESWEVGSSQQISWTSSGIIGDVRIEYSVDGGASWAAIVQSTQNDGTHNWTVPDTPSANCLVRITESDSDAGPTDVSDAAFSIVPSSTAHLIIASPNGGERLTVGSTHEITWTSSGTVGEIKIEYSTDNGASWSEIAASTENDGSYSWAVPDIQSDGCLVRVSETDGAPADTSDAVFSIVQSVSITVLAPNGGESWEACSSHDITWASSGNINNVKIEYSADSGVSWTTIVESTAGDGVYNWMVPDAQSDTCLVKIGRAGSDEEVWDVSDTLFSIAPPPTPTIKVTSPNGGERLIIDSIHEITWVSSGTVGGVSIEFSTDMGTTWAMIASSVEDNGTYSWTVPDIPSESCLVRVSEEDGDPSDVSDDLFYIDRSHSITVTRPNGGESWKVGSANDITWINDETIGEVKIEYSTDNGNSWIVITPSTENNGSYNWTVPDTPADQCLVRVSGLDADEGYWDVSDDVFAIIIDSPLRLTVPNGEESLRAGEHFQIEWRSDQTVENVKVEFSPDKGATYSVLNESIPNTGSYDWLTPPQVFPHCLVKISDAERSRALSPHILLYELIFRISGSSTATASGEAFVVWLGDALNESVSHTFPRISLIRESTGNDSIQWNDTIKEIEALSGNWHTLKILLNQKNQSVSLWLDNRAIFESLPLTSNFTFTPAISFAAGPDGSEGVDIDDLSIHVYDATEGVKEYITFLSEDFEGFAEGTFPEHSGWRRSETNNGDTKEIVVKKDTVTGKKYLEICVLDQNLMIAVKHFNIPDHFPFDVSDRSFKIGDQ
jgi:hypothetical protein